MDYLKIKDIIPDENQPRKYFNAQRMHSLSESIKREGIITPLVVEKVGDKYLLVDGERRFRAAQELKLEKVPVVIEEPKKAVERLVRQFTVQEQHEAWTPIEKAIALLSLSGELGVSLTETCKLLNIADTDIRRYVAFAELADKEAWVRNEVPLSMIEYFKNVRNTAKRVSEGDLKTEFTRSDEKKLEKRIIHGIKEGTIQRRQDLYRLSNSFEKDPKSLKKFMEHSNLSPTTLFLETGAQGVQSLRNVIYSATYVYTHGLRFLAQPDVKLTDGQITILKKAKDAINKILNLVE